MPRKKRTTSQIDGARETRSLAGTLGGEVKTTRRSRRMTQAQLCARVGLEQSRMSDIERGLGDRVPLATWVALGIALGRPLSVSFARELTPEPRDAGHLAGQELVLRLARAHGRRGTFELPTRPADPSRSIDVGIRDERERALVVTEIWNRMDDMGRATRDHDRKMAEAAALGLALGGDARPYRVVGCWLLRATAANRQLVASYPEILRARFPGSSLGWVRCLGEGGPVPAEPGIAWIDPASGRLVPIRRRS